MYRYMYRADSLLNMQKYLARNKNNVSKCLPMDYCFSKQFLRFTLNILCKLMQIILKFILKIRDHKGRPYSILVSSRSLELCFLTTFVIEKWEFLWYSCSNFCFP